MIYRYRGCCSSPDGIDRHCRLAEYEADPSYSCPECGKVLEQVITVPRFLNNTKPFEPYRSPVDGSIIASQHDLREHNKRNNVVNLHDGYDERGVQNFTKKDYQSELDKERAKDLASDMQQAIQKLEQGYKPQPAPEGDIVP